MTEQLREVALNDVEVSMLAVDGDYVADVRAQLGRLPEQSTHLFVSAGGNDALRHYQTLFDDFLSSEDLFSKWCVVQGKFRAEYRSMLEDVTSLNRPTTVCTIYDAVPGLESFALTALSLFNDVIVAEAVTAGLPIIDLRRVCSDPSDYSSQSPIEPSCIGGDKIAKAINLVFETHDFSKVLSTVYS